MEKIQRTNNDINNIIKEFIKTLNENKNLSSFKIETPEPKNKEKIKVGLTTKAYIKMKMLVANTSEECAWKGYVTHPTKNLYLIKDIYVYPQKYRGLHVESDDEKYPMWCAKLAHENPDVYNHLRFQGHSHVNASVSPSSTDLNYYKETISEIEENDFYIFMILNKSGDMWINVFDKKKNIRYEKTDIEVYIYEKDTNFNVWTEEQIKENLKEIKYSNGYGNGYPISLNGMSLADAYEHSRDKNKKSKKGKKGKKTETSFFDTLDERDPLNPNYVGRTSVDEDEDFLDYYVEINR